ncbi:MAG: glycine betaine ABC transporter substrate-binding protein [Bacilli bacterium]
MKITKTFILAFLFFILSSCASSSKKPNEIILLKGTFSEITIIQEMAKLLIEENTDLSVKFHDSMNTVAASRALQDKEVDLYVGYDGTVVANILQQDQSMVPAGMSLFDYANEQGQKIKHLQLLAKFGFENTYAVAVKDDTALKYKLKNISDLQKVGDKLIFGAEHEFFDEEGSVRFNPFTKAYNITWKENKSLEMGLKYAAMDHYNIDVTVVYSTDGLNKKSNFVILNDDKKFFPEYNASFFFRDSLFEEYQDLAPNLEEVLSLLNGQIDNEAMIELNYQVDAKGRKPKDVAYDFLKEKKLIK